MDFLKFQSLFGITIMVLLLAFSFTLFTFPVYACHQPGQPLPAGQPTHNFNEPPDPKSGPCPAGLKEIEGVFTNVVSVMVGLGFVALLVMLVLAGFKYLTSGGEQKALQSAHQTVTWALLGILFLAIAWLILQLIENFTGIKVTVFDVKTLVR